MSSAVASSRASLNVSSIVLAAVKRALSSVGGTVSYAALAVAPVAAAVSKGTSFASLRPACGAIVWVTPSDAPAESVSVTVVAPSV